MSRVLHTHDDGSQRWIELGEECPDCDFQAVSTGTEDLPKGAVAAGPGHHGEEPEEVE